MYEKRRGTTSRLGYQSLLFTLALIAPLMYLSGCGSGQSDVGQTGNSVPVSLSISMPQESEAASTVGGRFWATLQRWLPTINEAWAQQTPRPTPLSAIQVEVTGPDLAPISRREDIPPNTPSGSPFQIDLEVPVGLDRVFTVSGFVGTGDPRFQGKSRPTTLIAGQPASVEVILNDNITGAITGTVINANTQAALPRATIIVNGRRISTTTNNSGDFTLASVPAGSHALVVSAPGFTSVTTPSIQVTAGNTSLAGTIALTKIPTTGSITGTVINADTQASLSDKVIKVISVAGSNIIARTRTDGSFTLEEVPQGTQTVLFSITGFQEATRTVTVVAGQSVSTGTVALPVRTGTGTLIGSVIHATTRAPIQGATATVVVKATGASFQDQTDSAGKFSVPNVPVGFVTITISLTGFASQTREGSVKERPSDSDAGIILLVPISGGGSGRLTVSNAPAEVGGTFVVDPLLSSAATSSPGLGVQWGESGSVNGPKDEFVQLSYFPSRGGDIFIEFGVRESTNSVPVVWSCFSSSSSSSSCGVTVNTTTRTVTFSNSVLTIPLSNTPAITLNGTLTYPEPVTLP